MIISRDSKKGFTLIELMVVVAIIGILIAAIIVNINESRRKARDAKSKEELRAIAEAMEAYRGGDNGYQFPMTIPTTSGFPGTLIPLNTSFTNLMHVPTGNGVENYYWYTTNAGFNFCIYVSYAALDKAGRYYYYSSESSGDASDENHVCPGI